MPKGVSIQWDEWFGLRRFRLVRGVHFANDSRTFAQTVRNAAARRNARVSIAHAWSKAGDKGGGPVPCLVVTVVGPADLSAPRPKGFASPKQDNPSRRPGRPGRKK